VSRNVSDAGDKRFVSTANSCRRRHRWHIYCDEPCMNNAGSLTAGGHPASSALPGRNSVRVQREGGWRRRRRVTLPQNESPSPSVVAQGIESADSCSPERIDRTKRARTNSGECASLPQKLKVNQSVTLETRRVSQVNDAQTTMRNQQQYKVYSTIVRAVTISDKRLTMCYIKRDRVRNVVGLAFIGTTAARGIVLDQYFRGMLRRSNSNVVH
jgi:hypothetical protein